MYSVAIGHKLQYNTSLLMQLATSALLHDLGKTDVPIEIINKPGKLTFEEFEVIKQHPQMAVDRLKVSGQVSDLVLNSILNHHERYNGTGYPKVYRRKTYRYTVHWQLQMYTMRQYPLGHTENHGFLMRN